MAIPATPLVPTYQKVFSGSQTALPGATLPVLVYTHTHSALPVPSSDSRRTAPPSPSASHRQEGEEAVKCKARNALKRRAGSLWGPTLGLPGGPLTSRLTGPLQQSSKPHSAQGLNLRLQINTPDAGLGQDCLRSQKRPLGREGPGRQHQQGVWNWATERQPSSWTWL